MRPGGNCSARQPPSVKTKLSARLFLLLWLLAVALLVALVLNPVSNRLTRAGGLIAVFIVWRGVVALAWPLRRLRLALLGLTGLCAVLLLLPARDVPAAELRSEYATALRRYDGVAYHWGGENSRGIDCSGLVRRGLIDALFLRGVRTADGGRVRQALSLWWNDTSANALGSGHASLTTPLFDTPSVNALDQSQILPGDLAVTTSGVHIMIYLGGNQWMEADPGAGRVLTVSVPAADNGWFKTEMRLVRWRMLDDG
jgi:hypothetical protein